MAAEELDALHDHLQRARVMNTVMTHEHHHHTGLHDIEHLLSHLDLPQAVQD